MSHLDRHLDTDALADALAADVLPAHLSECPACASALEELRAALPAVSTALAALPAVPAVPAALERSVVPAAPAAATNVLPASALEEARSRRGRTAMAVAGFAAAAVLVVGGGLLLAHNATDTGSNATASRPEASAVRTTSSNTDYTKSTLAGAVPGLLSGTRALTGSAPTAQSGGPSTKQQPQVAAGLNDPLARLRTTAGLASCLSSIIGTGSTVLPLALDYARYEGKPALVIVLPTKRPSKLEVWVVGPTCTQTETALLEYERVDRPTS